MNVQSKTRKRMRCTFLALSSVITVRLVVVVLCHRGRGLLEKLVPLAPLALLPAVLMVRVADNEGDGEGGFAVDHLLVDRVHLTPAAGFLQRAAGEGAVADIR